MLYSIASDELCHESQRSIECLEPLDLSTSTLVQYPPFKQTLKHMSKLRAQFGSFSHSITSNRPANSPKAESNC